MMLTLVIGGAASGKSEFAEDHVLRLAGRRIYIATMEPSDGECRDRILRHQMQRQGKMFETVECYVNLCRVSVPPDANILLECMTNLAANERFRPDGGGTESVLRGIDHLLSICRHLTVVTGELGAGGTAYLGDTLAYLRDLGLVNREIAARADLVVEVVCGLPNVLKGALK